MAIRRHTRAATAPMRGAAGCKAKCLRDYPKDRNARVQCYLSCTERNHQRVLNEHTSGDPRWCWPQWPDLPAGASLTIDPSMPPPTTAQTPFCDWPAGKQVPSYPEGCRNMVPTQPRLSNAGSMHARVRARQAARRQSNPPRFSSTTREIVQLMRRVR